MVNEVILTGRLVKNPTVELLPNGAEVVKFSIAINKKFRDKNNNWKEITDFFDVKVFGKLTEKAKSLKKGYLVNIEGRLRQEKWTSRTGQKKTDIKVIARKINIIAKPKTIKTEKIAS
ncbi:MAG: single-stranded DNA-binding protein [Sulfurihydrogenibium sp.]|nr:single-stranded DNA-binding protein [Sulfurihydrogenibium sp.]